MDDPERTEAPAECKHSDKERHPYTGEDLTAHRGVATDTRTPYLKQVLFDSRAPTHKAFRNLIDNRTFYSQRMRSTIFTEHDPVVNYSYVNEEVADVNVELAVQAEDRITSYTACSERILFPNFHTTSN